MATGGLVLLATVSVALVLTTGLRAWQGGVLDQTPAPAPPATTGALRAPAVVTVTPPARPHRGPGSVQPASSSRPPGSAPPAAQPVAAAVALPPLVPILDTPPPPVDVQPGHGKGHGQQPDTPVAQPPDKPVVALPADEPEGDADGSPVLVVALPSGRPVLVLPLLLPFLLESDEPRIDLLSPTGQRLLVALIVITDDGHVRPIVLTEPSDDMKTSSAEQPAPAARPSPLHAAPVVERHAPVAHRATSTRHPAHATPRVTVSAKPHARPRPKPQGKGRATAQGRPVQHGRPNARPAAAGNGSGRPHGHDGRGACDY